MSFDSLTTVRLPLLIRYRTASKNLYFRDAEAAAPEPELAPPTSLQQLPVRARLSFNEVFPETRQQVPGLRPRGNLRVVRNFKVRNRSIAATQMGAPKTRRRWGRVGLG